ncbi:MAG TPA: Gfo/Idh/MocA family oxidoreductase, partial [Candidatus Eremiobacteraceae bacterium]|nr:Gfo/Idh/MocA family oxidoreductase [Candidatus Eremiobacteraceae bacterium]
MIQAFYFIGWGRMRRNSGNSKKPNKKVRYAVVGLGYISQIAVLPAFAHSRENSELSALVSSDPKKLKALSRKYKVPNTYSYEKFCDCLESGEIDAVYIALPNNLHRAYTEAAAKAGIHVLCEKPMAFTEPECLAMIEAAETAGVKLMIAYRLHFERGNLEAIKVVNSGKIGEPRIFTSVFSQQVRAGNTRLKKDIGGGALYDMGVYCINAARYLFKDEPEEVFGWNASNGDKRFKQIPEMTSGLLRFPGDRIASFTTSFGSASRSVFEVIGTKGVLKMDPAYELAEALKWEMTINDKTTKRSFSKRDQFAPELLYFSDCVLKNKNPEPSGREGLADVRIVEALLRSAETNRPVQLQTLKKEK